MPRDTDYATCTTCGQYKAPRGRSVPLGMYMCDHDCPGYGEPPLPGDLWPSETKEDFGFPCQTTKERNMQFLDETDERVVALMSDPNPPDLGGLARALNVPPSDPTLTERINKLVQLGFIGRPAE